MRLHTDLLTTGDLRVALPPAVDLDVSSHGSRSRHHAFSVALIGYGERHTRRRNTGQYGAGGDGAAATWSDWGRWLAELFERDPRAIAGQYNGAADFHAKTYGLFADDADAAGLSPRTLADEVRELQRRAPNCGVRQPIGAVARRHSLPEYIVTSAIFGE
jgi:hypothetical protein